MEPDRWYAIKHEIVMNTPGRRDGVIRGWLDGVSCLDASHLRFRDVDTIGIDWLLFSTFTGGSDETWKTSKDEEIWFADFEVRALAL